MNIGEAAKRSGLPAKSIRYYEAIGLARPAGRSASGYRGYTEAEVEMLRLLKHARELNFTIEECRELLAIYEARSCPSAEVKAQARRYAARMEGKLQALMSLRGMVAHVAGCDQSKTPSRRSRADENRKERQHECGRNP